MQVSGGTREKGQGREGQLRGVGPPFTVPGSVLCASFAVSFSSPHNPKQDAFITPHFYRWEI